MNARKELLEHIAEVGNKRVRYVHITVGQEWNRESVANEAGGVRVIEGSLQRVLPLLDFEYDDGYGSQELFGYIWYKGGTWSERFVYDGSKRWTHKACPPIPNSKKEGR